VDRPIHVFHGALDDYSPVPACKAFITRAAAAGHVIRLSEFPNAQHAFDVPLLSVQPVAIKGGQSPRHCQIEEQPAGHLRNSVTGQPFTYADACVELDPHVAYDVDATTAAHAAVKSLIAGLPSSNTPRP
jgi:dienelactone hydrolase